MEKHEKNKQSTQKMFDLDESELLSSFEKSEWKTVGNLKKEKSRAKKAATKTLGKDV